VALTPEVKATIAELGEVKYIAALDIEVRLKGIALGDRASRS
jgi:hypothetical protein